MDADNPVKEPAPKAAPGYQAFPTEADLEEPARCFSPGFIVFAVVVIGVAAMAGSIKSGKINLNWFFNVPKVASQAAGAPVLGNTRGTAATPGMTAAASAPTAAASGTAHSAPGAPGVHGTPTGAVPPLKPGAFIVTSISLSPPAFAIINGRSRIVGDTVEAPGVIGWKVARVMDGAVILQNGGSFATLPLTAPGLKPLDDELKPLN
jgi:hypothetical protein